MKQFSDTELDRLSAAVLKECNSSLAFHGNVFFIQCHYLKKKTRGEHVYSAGIYMFPISLICCSLFLVGLEAHSSQKHFYFAKIVELQVINIFLIFH
jgi:hypothetical protein